MADTWPIVQPVTKPFLSFPGIPSPAPLNGPNFSFGTLANSVGPLNNDAIGWAMGTPVTQPAVQPLPHPSQVMGAIPLPHPGQVLGTGKAADTTLQSGLANYVLSRMGTGQTQQATPASWFSGPVQQQPGELKSVLPLLLIAGAMAFLMLRRN